MSLIQFGRGQVDSVETARPIPGPTEVLVKVLACGVCRTDLHIVDGELTNPAIPVVPGHEIVGRIETAGCDATTLAPGTRIGIPWLGWSCGVCDFCRFDRENLCPKARYTGYQINGGYAEFAVADASFCFELPARYDDVHVAPLLCVLD
jgi:propanol-preferring alcohol dehydrogenase